MENNEYVAVNDLGYVIGQDHHNAKLTNHQIDQILQMRDDCMSYRQIAQVFGMSKSHIRNICKGRKRCQLAWQTKKRTVRLSR